MRKKMVSSCLATNISSKEISLSIVICSIRPIHTCALLSSLMHQLREKDQVIVIFDIPLDSTIQEVFASTYSGVEIYYNEQNCGLSSCRNLGMKLAKNAHLIFFDDDVFLPEKTIENYRELFAQGLLAIGGPLKLPPFYNALPRWLPRGFSSLLGIHTSQTRIWGANFGFNLKLALENDLFFTESLGRKRKGLISGDETDFLKRYSACFGESTFVQDLYVYHCIDLQRFKMPYLLRRAFWQGRSEVRKKTLLNGIKKEFQRSTTISSPKRSIRFLQRVVGIFLFCSFCIGVLTESFLPLPQKD